MPGTGKTASTLQVIYQLRKAVKFEFILINAMQLLNPNTVYTIIYEKLFNIRLSPKQAAIELDFHFKEKNFLKTTLVVLIDELDALVTNN
jgi:Cdc6-like AAA superfamily ATPase